MNKLEKYNVIKELIDYNGNKNRTCKNLALSRKQTITLDKSLSEDIILLYKSKYQDLIFNHFFIKYLFLVLFNFHI